MNILLLCAELKYISAPALDVIIYPQHFISKYFAFLFLVSYLSAIHFSFKKLLYFLTVGPVWLQCIVCAEFTANFATCSSTNTAYLTIPDLATSRHLFRNISCVHEQLLTTWVPPVTKGYVVGIVYNLYKHRLTASCDRCNTCCIPLW